MKSTSYVGICCMYLTSSISLENKEVLFENEYLKILLYSGCTLVNESTLKKPSIPGIKKRCLKGLTFYFTLLKVSGKLLYKHKFTVFAYFGILMAVKGAYYTGPRGIDLGIKCKV